MPGTPPRISRGGLFKDSSDDSNIQPWLRNTALAFEILLQEITIWLASSTYKHEHKQCRNERNSECYRVQKKEKLIQGVLIRTGFVKHRIWAGFGKENGKEISNVEITRPNVQKGHRVLGGGSRLNGGPSKDMSIWNLWSLLYLEKRSLQM